VAVLFLYAQKSYEGHGSNPQGFDLIMIFKWTVYQEELSKSKRKADIGNPKDHKKAQPKLSKTNCSAKPSRQNLINSSRRAHIRAAKRQPHTAEKKLSGSLERRRGGAKGLPRRQRHPYNTQRQQGERPKEGRGTYSSKREVRRHTQQEGGPWLQHPAERRPEITTSQQEEQKLGRQHLKQERESTKKAVHPTQEPI
jgi:hypothetical protein